MDVWLHVGTGKTGTSAIQVALVRGRARLAESGLFYPLSLYPEQDEIAEAGGITSGNGLAAGRLMNPRLPRPNFDPEAARDWLSRAVAEAGERTLLLSSETMQLPHGPDAAPVLDMLRQGGRRRVRILYYVRHALDFAVAGYAQNLKVARAAGLPADLDTHLSRNTVPFQSQLEAWAAVAGREAITCRLYDEDRAALVTRFLETVHPPAAALGLEAATATPLVNRSPTPTELRLLRLLNAEPDAAELCRAMVRGVLNAPPAVPEELVVPEPVFAAFAARNQPILDAVNRDWLLPAGRAPVATSAGRIRIGTPEPVDAARSEATFAASFIGAVRLLAREARTQRRPAAEPARPAMGQAGAALKATLEGARAHAREGRVREALAVLDAAPPALRTHARVQEMRQRLEQRLARPRAGAEA